MKFYFEIKNNHIIKGGNSLKKFLYHLKDGRYKFVVSKDTKIRSLDQNRLYWRWLNIMSQDLGYDPEELHCTFKAMFLTDRSARIPIVRSTTNLSTVEFIQYLEKVARVAAELGTILPLNEDDI